MIKRFLGSSQHLRGNRPLRKWKDHHARVEIVLTEKVGGVYVLPFYTVSHFVLLFVSTNIEYSFYWGECQFVALLGCPESQYRPDKLLNSLPWSLDEIYERMLQNIDADDEEDSKRMFTMLCCPPRPLKVAEVVDSLAIEPVHNPGLDGADGLRRFCSAFT